MTDSESQPQLGDTFQKETQNYSWTESLDFGRLQSDPSAIRERWDGRNTFSDALWQICFPVMPPGPYAHHTDLASFAEIINSREIWLRPIARQLESGEMTTFAKQFDFDGYLHRDAEGGRLVDDYARDLFALSLTNSAPGQVHWNQFGPVRMKLDVRPVQQRAELRRVAYADPVSLTNHPLVVLDAIAKKHFNKRFNAWKTSRMGAFYLGFLYEEEAEVRLLIKREQGAPALPIKATPFSEVLAVPLDRHYERVNIRLLAVQTQSQALVEPVRSALAASVPHWNVQVGVYGQ